jgi:hypothetical protein
MATRNPFGTVALGQEGSGLAQILTPYDSAKYDNAIIEQEQANRKEEAKALQEAKKDFKLGEMVDLDKSWEKDIDTYSSQFKELYDEEVSLFTDAINVRQINDYDTFLAESDKLTRRWAEHNKKAKLYNEDVYLSIQNKETFDNAKTFADNNQDKIDTELYGKREKEFTSPPDYVMKQAGGDLQKARIIYLRDYCDNNLVPQRFVHDEFANKITALTAKKAVEKGGGGTRWVDDIGGGVGGYVTSRNEVVTFDDNEMKDVVLANISNNKRALDYYRKQPMLEEPLKTYAKNINKNVDQLSYREMYDFMAQDPAAMDFMKTQYFWNDKSKSYSTFSEQSGGSSSGADIQTTLNDGTKQIKTKGNVFLEIVNTWGSENLRPQVSTNSLVTTNMSGKYIRKAGAIWTPSTRSESALKGEDAPSTPQRLKSTSIESNTIVIAKDNIDVNLGGQKITIKKGSAPPQELLNNKQFVSDNYNKLDYQIWSTAIFTDDATKLDNPISSPIEDMETLYTKDGYEEALKRNRVEFTPDGKILYYEDGELVNKDEQKNTQSSGSSGIEWK